MSVETEEFAATLRELKERSGRSYGALATRLHVSTSTLHRYCNGAAVPAEYAPVERLARACGASAEELVELHRRWILADAARRRETSSANTPAAPAAVPVTAQATAEPAPGPTPGLVPAPRSTGPVLEEEVTTVHPAPPPAAPRRRTRVLLSATAVAALAAVVSVLALRDAGGAANPGAASSAPPLIAAPAAPSTTAGTPAPPAPAEPPAAPSAVSSTAPSAADTSSATASASPEDVPAPFHVTVLNNNWDSPCNQWFLSARAPSQVPPPPSSGRVDSWAASQRMVPAGHLRIELTAQGASADTVVLNAMYVQVVSTRPAPKWNAYTPGTGCGGGLTPASFAVDLDSPAPRAVPVPGKEGERKTATTNFPYKITNSDPQVIDVDAATLSQDVSWFLELVWSDGTQKGTLRVDAGDHQPFRTVGRHGAPNYSYEGTSWAPAHDEG
ncbi:helix-turn-helix domain-containing protein [Kitasatospora sp. NPDC056651]|uniref:helix-turn-helix domain-containing protein n=1 Tax=Kitasatospora sp. NPDC056651 TaxID=3345892 RepID=UPI0036B41AF0